MDKLRRRKPGLIFILSVIIGTLLAAILHQFHNDPLLGVATKNPSIVVTSGLFIPVVGISLAIALAIIGGMFLFIQKTLPGTGLRKALLFGTALGGLYLVGMVEGYILFPISLLSEIYTGLADACGILLMSIVLGIFIADDTQHIKYSSQTSVYNIIIPLAYILFRCFSYTVLNIESSSQARPVATLIWTAAMGCWIMVMYILLGKGLQQHQPAKQAVLFGGMIFGVNFILFSLFALIFIEVSIADLLTRSIVDTIAVMAGVFVVASIQRRHVDSPEVNDARNWSAFSS